MNVKLARIRRGLTQEQLRSALKISSNRLINIEKGDYTNLKYPLMLKIANVLGTSPIELFFAD